MSWRRRVGSRVFGDRYGLALWLGLLVGFGLCWRVGIFISDTYTIANSLFAVSNGQLHITRTPYSLTLGSQPGLHKSGGMLYGRNYGQILLAAPLVWAFQALSVAVVPRLLLLGLWSGTALAFVSQVGRLGERHVRVSGRTVSLAGSGVVAVLFAAGALTATALPDTALPLAALQVSTMLAAATAGLVMYRLVGLWHDRAVATAAGAALGVASSVGFWASLPKRHVLVALLLLLTVYLFARSRAAYAHSRYRSGLWFRAGAYLIAGLVTWVHAFEGFFLVATLAVADLLTARRNSLPHLAAVGGALFLGSLPMLATNYLLSGNPFRPPRLLPSVGGFDVEFSPEPVDAGGNDGTSETAGQGATETETASDTPSERTADTGETEEKRTATEAGETVTDSATDTEAKRATEERRDSEIRRAGRRLRGLFDRATGTVGSALPFLTGAVSNGVDVLKSPDRLSDIFLRGGTIAGVSHSNNDYEMIELTMLEAVPLFGALAGLPVVVLRAGRKRLRQRWTLPASYSPRTQTDMFVAALAGVFTLVYLSRLPLHAQLTVRYLLPTVPLGIYAVARIPAVNAAVSQSTRWLAGGYVVSVVAGLILSLGTVAGLELALGEAVQLHALLNLGAAAACAVTVLCRTLVPDRVPGEAVALGLALPAGLTTAFLFLSGVVYFPYGPFALDFIRVLASYLPAV